MVGESGHSSRRCTLKPFTYMKMQSRLLRIRTGSRTTGLLGRLLDEGVHAVLEDLSELVTPAGDQDAAREPRPGDWQWHPRGRARPVQDTL